AFPGVEAFRRAPAGLMRCDVPLSTVAEADSLGGIELSFDTSGAARFDRVTPIEPCDPAFLRPPPGFGQADRMERPQAHLPQLAGFLESEHPAFCAAGADLKIEPATVPIIAAPPSLRDAERCQLPNR